MHSDKQRMPLSNRDMCAIYAPFVNGPKPASAMPAGGSENIMVVAVPAMGYEYMSMESFLEKYSATSSVSDFSPEKFVQMFEQKTRERECKGKMMVYMFGNGFLTLMDSVDVEQ